MVRYETIERCFCIVVGAPMILAAAVSLIGVFLLVTAVSSKAQTADLMSCPSWGRPGEVIFSRINIVGAGVPMITSINQLEINSGCVTPIHQYLVDDSWSTI